MNVKHLLGRSIFKLFGGQKRKIACASVAALHPEIYVLDEPTSGFDFTHMCRVAENIRRLGGMGKTVFVITHDPGGEIPVRAFGSNPKKGEI